VWDSLFQKLLGKSIFRRQKLFYLDQQSYVVRYCVVLSNNTSHEKNLKLFFPLPASLPHQVVLESPRFSQLDWRIKEEPRYGNRYAVAEVKLKAGQEFAVEELFQVSIIPHVYSGGSFKLEDYQNVRLPETNRYLAANNYLRTDNYVKRMARQVVAGEEDLWNILTLLNNFVSERLRYGSPKDGLYTAYEALDRKTVDCGGFNTLFVSLCLTLNIPARIVSGFWLGYEHNEMHSWVQILLPDGSFISADPSVEHLRKHKRTKKLGCLGKVGSDRLIFSWGSDLPLVSGGNKYFAPILQHPFISAREGLDGLEAVTKCISSFLLA